MKSFSIALLLIALALGSVSCVYTEGDNVAKQAFTLMSAKERVIYDQVESEWGEAALVRLREAVRQRQVKANETSLPFIDVKDVVVLINDTTLTLEKHPRSKQLDSDEKTKALNNKFDRLAPEWYAKLTNRPPAKVLVAEKPEPQVQEGKGVVIKQTTVVPDPSPVDEGDLASGEDLSRFKTDIILCPDLAEFVASKVDVGKPVLKADLPKMERISAICKAKMLL